MKTHHKTSAFTATLAIILLVGRTNSNPVEPVNDVEQTPEDARPAAIPAGKCYVLHTGLAGAFHFHEWLSCLYKIMPNIFILI